MNTNTFSTEKQEQYKQSKQKLLSFLNTLDEPFAHASDLLEIPRQDSVASISDKLQKDIFSLVLIGAFQSGKSTLFNYLCDGRELSPVGPGGGGIRTSGCRVTAHYLPEEEDEYALVTWRTPDELLRSLGKALLPYYGEERGTSGADYLTEKLVNLHDAEQRALLEQRAWEQLENPQHGTEDKELLYFTLLVCRFFPQFAERACAGETRVSVEEATRLTAYPQNWKMLWQQARKSKDLSAFEGLVSFAFVGGVDLYLNSPFLRNLGCSVTDCPGLFISKWDTMIAERCIREANALLYLFSGEKALTQEDKKALQTCVELGGEYKILFGANLRIAASQWQRIEEADVQPDLKDLGFNKPVIHSFHSGIALRARERFRQEFNLLDQPSQQGIDLDISLDPKFVRTGDAAADRTKYLEKVLNRFIFNLTGGEESLSDYDVKNPDSLEALSHVPSFIQASQDFVVEHKAPSLLVHQGISVILCELQNKLAELRSRADMLSQDSETAKKKLEACEKELATLRRNKKQAEENITNCIKANEKDVMAYYEKVFCDSFQEQQEEIKDLFWKNRPSTWERIIGDYNQATLCGNYADGMQKVYEKAYKKVKEKIKSDFSALSGVRAISKTYENERVRLMDDVRGLRDFPQLEVAAVKLPEDWGAKAAEVVIPDSEEVWSALVGEGNPWMNAVWTIVSFGMREFFVTKKDYKEAFYRQHGPRMMAVGKALLWKKMYEQESPMGAIWYTVDCFAAAFDVPLEQAEKLVKCARKDIAEKDTAARKTLIAQLNEASETYSQLIAEGSSLEKEIKDNL